MHQIKLNKVRLSLCLDDVSQLNHVHEHAIATVQNFFFIMSCPGFMCVCVFANARIVYLLISNRLVIIRLSSTAAIGVIYKNFSYSSASRATIQRFCMRDFYYTLASARCRESTDVSFILCVLFSHSQHFSLSNGLSDCIVCTYIVPWQVLELQVDLNRVSFPVLYRKHLNNINRI